LFLFFIPPLVHGFRVVDESFGLHLMLVWGNKKSDASAQEYCVARQNTSTPCWLVSE